MERLLLTLVVLIVVLVAAGLSELPGLEARSTPRLVATQEDTWVRTTQGWERAEWQNVLIVEEAAPVTYLDPRVVGTLQLLLSLAALLALPACSQATKQAG